MRILNIYLKYFSPISFISNIEEIQIDFENVMTLIIGTNGCGKSSLIKELTPLPPSPDLYRSGGEKRICIEYNGDQYLLISVIKKDFKHTFIKNGETLYSNITTTQFREIVINEFNYSPLIHKVLTGELKFTEMTPAARREILTIISPLNLDYGIQLYNLVKEAVRDTHGALKHVITRSTDIKTKLADMHIPEDTETRKVEIESELNSLLPYTTPNLPNLREIISDIEMDFSRLLQIKQKLDKFDDLRLPIDNINSVEELNEYIGICAGKITAIQMNITNISNEIENLSGVTNSILDNNLSLDELKYRISTIEASLSHYTETNYVNSNFDSYLNTIIEFAVEVEVILGNCRNISYYPVEQRVTKLKEANLLKESILLVTNSLKNIDSKIEHLTNSDVKATCPKCKIEFSINKTTPESNLEKLKELRSIKESELLKLNKELTTYDFALSSINIIELAIAKFKVIKSSIYMPFEFWENMPDIEDILANNHKLHNYLTKWRMNIEDSKAKQELKIELDSCNKALQIFNKYGREIDVKLVHLEDSVVKELNNKKIIETQYAICKTVLKNITQYNEIYNQADSILKNLSNKFKVAIESEIQVKAKSHSANLYDELAERKNLLNIVNNLTNTITELEEDYNNLSTEKKCLSILEEQLSYNKGLLAEQLLGYIGSFVEHINIICKEIWGYQIEVGICNVDNGVLDYSFPLLIEDETVKDIKFASQAQSDLINLAFTLVMRQHLSLTNYPLYLDETGNSFDEQHRIRIIQYIKQLQHSKQFSQLFIINHYIQFIGGFTGQDIVVLDTRNITLPNSYNTSVIIKHRGDVCQKTIVT